MSSAEGSPKERNLSLSEIKSMTKPDLVKAYAALQNKEHPTNPELVRQIHELIQETKATNANTTRILERLEKIEADIGGLKAEQQRMKSETNNLKDVASDNSAHIACLEKENDLLRDIVINQQAFLEATDARERACNAIITGVSEEPDELGSGDREKVAAILNIILQGNQPADGAESGSNADPLANITDLKRLGNVVEGKTRPLLVTFVTKGSRDKTTDNARNLKKYKSTSDTKNTIISKVYVKKDMHPAWRREKERLWKMVRDERRKPENEGARIEYNAQQRSVTRNGLVIDRFHPKF
jgi:uncharacterized protein YdcH (DUF465 family)